MRTMKKKRRDRTSGLEPYKFTDLRADWYTSNGNVPPALRQCLTGDRPRIFLGFPRHWLPMFHWLGVPWRGTVEPKHHMAFFSTLSENAIVTIIEQAEKNGKLRPLLEASAVLDPVLSDALYIIDNDARLSKHLRRREDDELTHALRASQKLVYLTTWAGYGRQKVKDLERMALTSPQVHTQAVILPCSLKRPYNLSKTHKKMRGLVEEAGFEWDWLDHIVMTSLGLIPEPLWKEPAVLRYDAGVPDIYRTLRLARAFFVHRSYVRVLDCLHFEPYSDVLRICAMEKLIPQPVIIGSGKRWVPETWFQQEGKARRKKVASRRSERR